MENHTIAYQNKAQDSWHINQDILNSLNERVIGRSVLKQYLSLLESRMYNDDFLRNDVQNLINTLKKLSPEFLSVEIHYRQNKLCLSLTRPKNSVKYGQIWCEYLTEPDLYSLKPKCVIALYFYDSNMQQLPASLIVQL